MQVCFSAAQQAWCLGWRGRGRWCTGQSPGTGGFWRSMAGGLQDPCSTSNAPRSLSVSYTSLTVRFTQVRDVGLKNYNNHSSIASSYDHDHDLNDLYSIFLQQILQFLFSEGGGDFLSVAHVTNDGLEFIPPVTITDSHVVVNITGFSAFGKIGRASCRGRV